MIRFKACPKCQGDLIDRSDHYGHYLSCIQCGRYIATPTNDQHGDGKDGSPLNTDLAKLLAA